MCFFMIFLPIQKIVTKECNVKIAKSEIKDAIISIYKAGGKRTNRNVALPKWYFLGTDKVGTN